MLADSTFCQEIQYSNLFKEMVVLCFEKWQPIFGISHNSPGLELVLDLQSIPTKVTEAGYSDLIN